MTKERIARQNINWKIIDGGMVESNFIQEESLGKLIPFGRIPDTFEAGETIVSGVETTIEFVGPKKLPRITELKKEDQQEKKWNIRNFFRLGKKPKSPFNTPSQ